MLSIAGNIHGQVQPQRCVTLFQCSHKHPSSRPLTWCRLQGVPFGTVVESPGSDDSKACSLGIIQNFQHLLLQSRICSSCHEVIAIAAGEKKRRSIQLKASPVRGKLDKTRSWCWALHSEILTWQVPSYTLFVATWLRIACDTAAIAPVFFLTALGSFQSSETTKVCDK